VNSVQINARLAVLAVLAIGGSCTGRALAEQAYWELAPYRIQALIAIDVPTGLAEQFATDLPGYLLDRARTTFGPAWQLDAQIASGSVRQQLLRHMASPAEADLPEIPTETDKYLLLAIQSTPTGYELSSREYDCYVHSWSATVRRQCRQEAALPEQLFQLARDTVRTLAQMRIDPKDEQRVSLTPRGVDLPNKSDDVQWVRPGEVFVPIWRRTTREGELVPDGIQVVPWTYLEAEGDSGREVAARVYSANKRPFGVRHRGRIEQLAISLPVGSKDTVVQFYSRTDKKKPLAGYEVYAQNTGQHSTELLGRSDRNGQLQVPPGQTRVQLLYVRSGGELLARVPVVPGAESLVRVPLPDDELRLQVEAQLAALREDLVDVVARRNILIARIRQAMDQGDYQQARQLMEQLDQLPDRAHFSRTLSIQSRMYHSNDPIVQKRIDELFAATQVVLAQFLDVRSINELQDELLKAQKQGS
jgi:hypothetical protein